MKINEYFFRKKIPYCENFFISVFHEAVQQSQEKQIKVRSVTHDDLEYQREIS